MLLIWSDLCSFYLSLTVYLMLLTLVTYAAETDIQISREKNIQLVIQFNCLIT